jgi:hypothetical protein
MNTSQKTLRDGSERRGYVIGRQPLPKVAPPPALHERPAPPPETPAVRPQPRRP